MLLESSYVTKRSGIFHSPYASRLRHKHRILNGSHTAAPTSYLYKPSHHFALVSDRSRLACGFYATKGLDDRKLSTESKPRFTQRLRSRVIQENHSVKFTCMVLGSPSPRVSWYKGRTLISGAQHRYSVANNHGMCILEIPSCTIADTGDYACRAESSAGNDETSAILCVQGKHRKQAYTDDVSDVRLSLTSKYEVDCEPHESSSSRQKNTPRLEVSFTPEITKPLQSLTVYTGSIIKLECTIEGKPTPSVTWLKDQQILCPSERTLITGGANPALLIRDACPEDQAEYCCVVENSAGKDESYADVTVKDASKDVSARRASSMIEEADIAAVMAGKCLDTVDPVRDLRGTATNESHVDGSLRFVRHLQGKTLSEGSSMILEAEVNGVSDFAIAEWLRNGKKIPDNPDFAKRRDGNVFIMNVAEMFPEDSGMFGLEIVDGDNYLSSTCSIFVNADDEDSGIEIKEFPQSVTTQAGATAEISCQLESSTAVGAKLLKDDVEMDAGKHSIEISDENRVMITMSKIPKEAEGLYVLVLTNEESKVNMSFAIHVID